jgi:SAM-dependent methyltransferase
VTGCDPSRAFIDHARSGARDTAVSFVVAATGGLPARDGGYGCIASLLALNFFPDRAAALREMRGLAAPGGTVSACVWDYPGRMDILRYFWDAACALDPQARSRHEAERFAFCEPIALTGVFRQAGLREVCCEAIDIPTPCASVDDYWRPFLAGAGPAGAYVQGLSEPQREALARRLTRSLPRDAEGRVPLAARAWVVRGAV